MMGLFACEVSSCIGLSESSFFFFGGVAYSLLHSDVMVVDSRDWTETIPAVFCGFFHILFIYFF